ncbi:MAG: hypothetical protein AAFY60_16970, partial [Myxococcota bacterium]
LAPLSNAMDYFPYLYFPLWFAFGLGGALHVRAQRNWRKKKTVSDRWTYFGAVFLAIAFTLTLIAYQRNSAIPALLGAVGALTYVNLKGTSYCSKCLRRSVHLFWWRNSIRCRHCGTDLKSSAPEDSLASGNEKR